MKILITGSAGFIGFHTTIKFLEYGYEVIGLDNINNYYDIKLKYARLSESGIDAKTITYNKVIYSNKYPNYKFIKLNLEDFENLSSIFKTHQFDLVIHLAAQAGVRYSITNPETFINSNIFGFHNILECCRKYQVLKLLYASSSSVYGISENEILTVNDNTDSPISLYAATKKTNELFAHVYSHLYGIKTIGLRFFTVYGPWGRPDMAPFLFTDSIIDNRKIKVFNNGNMLRDFTYIDDIVNGIFLITITENIKNIYTILNIGNSKPINLLDFINCIEKKLNITSEKEFLEIQPGDVVKTYADITEFVNLTGYRPRVNINEGVEIFIEWFIKYYKK